MERQEYSRRKFISKCLGSGSMLAGGGTLLLGSCDTRNTSAEDKKEAPATDFCDDLSKVSEAELVKRKTFAYVDKSPVPDRLCGNCGLFLPKATTQNCGNCMLFKGPVRTAGHCIQWTAKG